MGNEMIVIIVESVVIFAMAVVIVILGMKLSRKPKGKADNVIIKDGVRYTREENETTADGGVKITHRENDVILEKGVNYIVEKGGKVIPGKYTVLSAQEGTDRFNLRLGGLVREYQHASDIVLAEGETVCAVSQSVILR